MRELTREEAELLTSSILSIDPDKDDNFFARLAKCINEDGRDVPAVRLEYSKLQVVVDATSSAGALPSLPNVFKLILKVISLLHKPHKCFTRDRQFQCIVQTGVFPRFSAFKCAVLTFCPAHSSLWQIALYLFIQKPFHLIAESNVPETEH
jgi:hypothetical protein